MASFDERRPGAIARWLKEQNGGRPVRFEKVEPGDEQILEDREQRELDRCALALGAPARARLSRF